MKAVLGACLLSALFATGTWAQQTPVPQPFPGRQTQPKPATPPAPVPPPAAAPAVPAPTAPRGDETPGEATLGVPIFPSAQYLTSYDAGHGQRFYLFGTLASFADVVAYYKSVLKQKGDLVFEEPATHMFEVGRFREETMGFPPSVTVKDYTWGGMPGYANPAPGADPARFPTVVQVVPVPAATPPASGTR